MKKEGLVKLKTRKLIYNYILKYPGLHLRGLSRKLKIPKTTIRYHLNFLKKRDLIREENVDNRVRYYAINSIGAKDKQLFSLIRKEIPRKIILILCVCMKQSQKDIIYFDKRFPGRMNSINFVMGKHRTTISFHLHKLEEMGIIESWQEGNQTMYKLKDIELIIDFLIKYEGKLFDSATGQFIKWMELITMKDESMDGFLKKLFEIFPHPYHC